MTELILPTIIFSVWIIFSIVFIFLYKRYQTRDNVNKKSFWNNSYIFDSIPPVFPTLGIFCTALGITIGIWNFNTVDIQSSIPQLLKGLRLAFVATMAGILGLIVFQKIIAIVQKKIDDNPNRPRRQTDELSAISELTLAVEEFKIDNQIQIEKLIRSFGDDLDKKVSSKLTSLELEVINLQKNNSNNQHQTDLGLQLINKTTADSNYGVMSELGKLKELQSKIGEKANRNTDDIIKAMGENNKLTAKKFDEFSELLKKNNTEALVEVMKNATEQFNSQMSELINRLVKENFAELNNSVNNLNNWQKENKEQVHKLTQQFQLTTEMFNISANTLKEVAFNTKSLTDDDSKLNQIVRELRRVMIDDGKLQELAGKLTNTVLVLENTSESFNETTTQLNEWIKKEKSFKEAAQILITKLEEFRDLNGDVWEKYRKEMKSAVSVIKETSKSISEDLENINSEFYERLNDTLTNLDQCIQRFVPNTRR